MEEVGVCARGKTLSKETTFKKLLSRRSMELRTYESVCLTQNLALRVLISYSDASVFVDIRDTIFGRNFSTAVSTLLKESESVAHTRRTNTPTKEQHERPHVINGIVLRERERERITLSERVYDDDDDAKCIRVRSSMRFDDLFVGEAEGNNIDENENESY